MDDYLPRIEDTELKRNRTGYWEIRWTVPAERTGTGRARSRSRSCNTRDYNLAVKIRREYLASAATTLAGLSLPTIRELVGRYEADLVATKGTKPTQMQSLRPIVHFVGDLTPDQFDSVAQTDYKALRARGRAAGYGRGPAAPGTIRRELGALTAVLSWAKSKRHIPRDVDLTDIDLPPEGQAAEVYLDADTEREFYAHCERVFRWTKVGVGSPQDQMSRKHLVRAALFSMIALSTWSRSAAIEGLTWDRVDLKRKLIDFRDVSTHRTAKRRVPVPMEDRLWWNLARQWLRQGKPRVGLVLGTRGEMRKSFARLKLMFPGVIPAGLTRHALRHTGATLAAQDGVPLFTIAGMLGDSLETTEKHYAHHHPDYLRAAVNRRK